ncbi:MAG: dockerin type I repeat-containing protein [Planctomycetota bacterium]|nr:dockerin type I repeat-containing protein [Planctomycetota bacterium]
MKPNHLLPMLGTVVALSGVAAADSIAELTVDSGSTASVQLRVEISTFLGGSDDTDSTTVSVTGFAAADLIGDDPFNAIDINDLSLDLTDASLDYEFYCSIFGCLLNANVTVTNFNLGIAETLSGNIGPDGSVTFSDALFNPSFGFNANIGGAISETISGDFNDVAAQTFGCRVDAAKGIVFIDNFAIDQIVYDIDPASLPTGVNSVRIIADVNLGGVSMTGAYVPDSVFGDLNGDGQVNAADLGLLVAAWGPCKGCAADLNGDGQVNAADLGLLVAAWT